MTSKGIQPMEGGMVHHVNLAAWMDGEREWMAWNGMDHEQGKRTYEKV